MFRGKKLDAEVNISIIDDRRPLSVTENGRYDAPAGVAFNPVNVSVGTNTDSIEDVKASLASDITVFAKGEYVTGEMEELYNGDFSVSEDGGDLVVTADKNGHVQAGRNIVENIPFGEIDENLTEENIKSGVSIFGVTGTYTGE